MVKCVNFIKKAKDRVLIESPSRATDGIGGQVTTWNTVGTFWAWVRPTSDNERYINSQLRGESTHKMVIRYNSSLDDIKDVSAYKLTLDSREHTITGVRNFDANLKDFGKFYQEITTIENGIEISG